MSETVCDFAINEIMSFIICTVQDIGRMEEDDANRKSSTHGRDKKWD